MSFQRQAKLSFGSAESKKRPLVDMTNNDEKSVTRRSGFDLWSEKNKSEILKTYDGDTASFNMFLIQKFRGLDAQEKKVIPASQKKIYQFFFF